MTIKGTKHDDDLTGTKHNDTFDLSQGGNDKADGGGGKDTFIFKGAFTAADRIDGGSGNDTLSLSGNYTGSHSVIFGAKTMVDVEKITLADGHSYTLKTNDANVATGHTLTVDAHHLTGSSALFLDGHTEKHASYHVTGGSGDDTLTTGGGNDVFNVSQGGQDHVTAGAGNDTVNAGASLAQAGVFVDGGKGNDILNLNGDYFTAGPYTLSDVNLNSVEHINMADGNSYHFTVDVLPSGATLDAHNLSDPNVLYVDASSDSASIHIIGGAGNDSFVSTDFADTFTGGTGSDSFDYDSVAESTGKTYDTITDLDTDHDNIAITIDPVGGSDVITASIDKASFNTGMADALDGRFSAGHWAPVEVNAGDLKNHVFLFVDANSDGFYNAGSDFVFDITGFTGSIGNFDTVLEAN